MQRKYFVAFGVMDKENLRCNPGYHGTLIFLYANCDEQDNIKFPLRISGGYSFYSHPLPYEKSFFEEPLAFFTQKIAPEFRFRGSYGEWKPENIHDLCYGRGLTGRLFAFNSIQMNQIKKSIQKEILKQKRFLSEADDIDREENYKNFSRTTELKLIKEGIKPAVAKERTKDLKPLAEFNTFPLSGGQNTCKTAILDKISECYDARTEEGEIILNYIYYLRYGGLPDNAFFIFPRFLTSFIPRFTPNLEEFIFHCASEKWTTRGGNSKYPYCEWQDIEDDEIFAITAGSWYVDLEGYQESLFTPDIESRTLILNLKTITRICEINISGIIFKIWHNEISKLLEQMGSCTNAEEQRVVANTANEYLTKLIASTAFKETIDGKVPVNLKPLLEEVYQTYKPTPQLRPYYSW